MKKYFFDADGVLFLYERDAYVGENPIWLQKNRHYFKNLEPDRKMMEIMDRLHNLCRYTGDEVYILTSLLYNGTIFNEHFHDKISSYHKWFPYIDIDHIIISTGSKRDAVEYITNNPISEDDILIDDYNKNLKEWDCAGGTSIKYCNGINDPKSFNGLRINENNEPVDVIMKTLIGSTILKKQN